MSTPPEPDHRIAVVLATEEGRTAVVALISDRTGPVDTVILERPPRHNRGQRQRRRLILEVTGRALARIERPSTVGIMCGRGRGGQDAAIREDHRARPPRATIASSGNYSLRVSGTTTSPRCCRRSGSVWTAWAGWPGRLA